MTTATTPAPNALAAIRQTEQTITRRVAAAAGDAAAELRSATTAAKERIALATRDAAAYVARTLAECLADLEALASDLALDTIEHVPAEQPALPAPEEEPAEKQREESEPAVVPMASAAQTTLAPAARQAAATPVAPALTEPFTTDEDALMAWVQQQREQNVGWAALAEAVCATGRDVTPDALRMRFQRWRKASGQAD